MGLKKSHTTYWINRQHKPQKMSKQFWLLLIILMFKK
jgi:hypothetical protein